VIINRLYPDSDKMQSFLEDAHNCEVSVEGVILFFLVAVRTVWNNQRAHTYEPNSVHSHYALAKWSAYRSRKCGTSFRVRELPALRFNLGEKSLLVTQINEPCPLRGFPSKDLEIIAKESPLNILRLVNAFQPNSLSWRERLSPDNSILFLEAGEASYFPLKSNSRCRTLKSYAKKDSIGLSYMADNELSGSAVLRLLRVLKSSKSGEGIDEKPHLTRGSASKSRV